MMFKNNISYDSDVIIMDEPTSALADHEIDILYAIVRRLVEDGVTIVFISHKLEEIFALCDRVTVLRDGKYIGTRICSKVSQDELVQLIVGRELKDMFPKEFAEIGAVVLEVKNLCGTTRFQDISFQLRRGEILGICGLMGAGRTEIMRAIFGIDKLDGGEIHLDGKRLKIKSPKGAIKAGIGMITEDRLRMGIFSGLSVLKNITLVNIDAFTNKLRFLKKHKEAAACTHIVDKLNIKIASSAQMVNLLSGGNQQKAIIGRWLMANPKVLILDEPTRGIDVGSKSEIHRQISKLAQQGMSIIMVSSEMSEVLWMSDRILVIREGRIAVECTREEANKELLIKHAFGV